MYSKRSDGTPKLRSDGGSVDPFCSKRASFDSATLTGNFRGFRRVLQITSLPNSCAVKRVLAKLLVAIRAARTSRYIPACFVRTLTRTYNV